MACKNWTVDVKMDLVGTASRFLMSKRNNFPTSFLFCFKVFESIWLVFQRGCILYNNKFENEGENNYTLHIHNLEGCA